MSSIHFAQTPGSRPVEPQTEIEEVFRFFGANPIASTPLVSLEGLSRELGLGSLELKDESKRLGMNAFKIVGANYAISRLAAQNRTGDVLACATDGNHGRAVARAARDRHLECHVFVPDHMVETRREAIRREGAQVHPVEGTYDEAVARCASISKDHGWTVVSDTAWEGYEEIPGWIMAGYSWIAEETSRQWRDTPDFVFLQAGVGGFACGIISWFLSRTPDQLPTFVIVEPAGAACVQAAARVGKPVLLAEPPDTVMAGLSCGEASPAAYPILRETVSAYLAVDDDWAECGMRLLANPCKGDPRVVAGEAGVAGFAGLLALRRDPSLADAADRLGLDPDSRVLVFNTEGDTDPENYQRVIRTDDADVP